MGKDQGDGICVGRSLMYEVDIYAVYCELVVVVGIYLCLCLPPVEVMLPKLGQSLGKFFKIHAFICKLQIFPSHLGHITC